jgi:hypothetical protein
VSGYCTAPALEREGGRERQWRVGFCAGSGNEGGGGVGPVDVTAHGDGWIGGLIRNGPLPKWAESDDVGSYTSSGRNAQINP